MPSRKDCLEDITKRTGRPRKDVDDLLGGILDRAEGLEHDGMGPDEAYAKARDEKLQDIAARAAVNRRAQILDTQKTLNRHRFYADTRAQIAALRRGEADKTGYPKLLARAERYALEAKLVGVNLPFMKNRFSVDAQYVAQQRLWIGGLSKDLRDAGLLKMFASRHLEDKWTEELFQLNRGADGESGITKNADALEIAKALRKWQTVSMGALNREGAWVRSYSGFITRTSHSPDKIAVAGPEKWISDTLPRLDLGRTFGTSDPQHARDMLFQMFAAMRSGDHFDYGKPVEEPLYPNLARKASAERELHFKDAQNWREYNEQYGVSNPTATVVQALRIAARRVALMKEFGTRPREAYESDKQFLLAKLQAETEGHSTRIGALEAAMRSPAAGEPEIARLTGEIEEHKGRLAASAEAFEHFKSWQIKLDNRFAQIDGSSMKPIDRAKANVVANIMSVQRMAKLGNIFATHFASLPTKTTEASYWGMPMADRYASLWQGFGKGAEGSAKREALDMTLVALENELGHHMNAYDVADAPAGRLGQAEQAFFQLTGVSAVIDNQRGGFEAMAAAFTGSKRDLDWNAIGPAHQRVLKGFGMDEAMWKALKQVEWTHIDGKTYLFPSDAMKLSDEQVKAYLKESSALGRREPSADDVSKGREDLALTLAATYADRGGYAVPMPSARIRAMLFGKDYEPGSSWNMAKKLFWQFKIWPADMITRAWEREIYGRIGDSRYDRMSALVEGAVGAIVFGVAAEGIRDIIKGQDPLAKMRHSPFATIAAGAQRSGMGSIVGDYLLGQFDRHGLSAAANLLGPTFGQIDTLADLLHAGGETKEGMLSASANRQRAADLIRLAKDNTPFMNLWLTHHATDALIWHRLQELFKPGYLERSERRQKDLQGTEFWLSPAKADQWMTGRRDAFTPEGKWNLGGH